MLLIRNFNYFFMTTKTTTKRNVKKFLSQEIHILDLNSIIGK